jgi:tRNA(Ile)-lysidine synthase
LRVEEDCDAIVLAHHRDDQVETLIQKIFRASSPQNWMGMKAWDEQRRLLRPWLSITKAEIFAYASSKAVPFREDASNNQTKYNRNWIRNRWKPDLDQHFPGWEANILGMQEYAKLLGQYRDHWLAESVSTREKEDHEGISIAKLATCPEMMRQDLLKAFIESHSLYDAHAHLSAGILVEAVKLMGAETGSTVPISDRLLIYRDRDQLRLSPSDAFHSPLSGDSPVEFDKASLPMKQLGFSFALQSLEQVDVPLSEQTDLYLDVHDVPWPLRLRTWKPGDRFNPIGMKGHMKISDFLINRKVPRHIKSGYLVLEDGNKKIIAVLYPPQNNNESNHVGIPSDDHKCSIDTFEVMMVTRMES